MGRLLRPLGPGRASCCWRLRRAPRRPHVDIEQPGPLPLQQQRAPRQLQRGAREILRGAVEAAGPLRHDVADAGVAQGTPQLAAGRHAGLQRRAAGRARSRRARPAGRRYAGQQQAGPRGSGQGAGTWGWLRTLAGFGGARCTFSDAHSVARETRSRSKGVNSVRAERFIACGAGAGAAAPRGSAKEPSHYVKQIGALQTQPAGGRQTAKRPERV